MTRVHLVLLGLAIALALNVAALSSLARMCQ